MSKLILCDAYNTPRKYSCIHCGDGMITLSLKKDGNNYLLYSRFVCQSYDDESIVWRGDTVNDLVKFLKSECVLLDKKQTGHFISQLVPFMEKKQKPKKLGRYIE